MQATPTRLLIFDHGLSSGARELLKWIALLTMTGDHVAKVMLGGYVPVISELGRIAFPLFTLVMACNLAQPGADLRKSMRRLALWGLIAQPLHALAFGFWLPLNILFTYAFAVMAVQALANNRPVQALLAACVLPVFVDYQWVGVGSVLLAWIAFRHHTWWLLLVALVAVIWVNSNGWALLTIPVVLLAARAPWRLPRWRWAFYGYYTGHLLVLAIAVQVRA